MAVSTASSRSPPATMRASRVSPRAAAHPLPSLPWIRPVRKCHTVCRTFFPTGAISLYVNYNAEAGKSDVMIAELSADPQAKPGRGRRLMANDTEVRWAPHGYLLFVREQNLLAQPFDASRLELQGEPMLVAEHVDTGGIRNTSAVSVSANGILVYRHSTPAGNRLVWLDRAGKEAEHVAAGEGLIRPLLSPNGEMAAGHKMLEGRSPDIWLVDLARGTPSRFTFDPKAELWPVWSPDGKRIAYTLEQQSGYAIVWKDASGTGNPEFLFQSPDNIILNDWSSDGRWLIYSDGTATVKTVIWALPVTGDHKPVPVVSSPSRIIACRLSADGRYIAYLSNESGQPELYVRTFSPGSPASGGKWQISTGGIALDPAKWRADAQLPTKQALSKPPLANPPSFVSSE